MEQSALPFAFVRRRLVVEFGENLDGQASDLDHADEASKVEPVVADVEERTTVPLVVANERGELVAYAGRAIDASEPRYRLPGGFHKSVELFNLHRAGGDNNPDKRVVLVEGFFDCMKVTRAGFPCVALMGSSLSEQQEQLLGQRFYKVCLLMDGDAAGKEAGETIAQRLLRRLYVRVIDLPEGKHPDQLGADEICSLLGK